MRQNILFDLDGTLADSRPGIMASLEAALRVLGHEPKPDADLSFTLGPPIDTTMGRVLEPYGETRIGEALAAYRSHQATTGMHQSQLYPGILPVLSALKADGHRLFVATSKRFAAAKAKLEILAIDHFFEDVAGSLDDGSLNDKAELIASVIRANRLNAGEVAMVGDRSFDMIGARANRVEAIGALWGYGSRDELIRAGADRLCSDPPALRATTA